MKLNWGHGIAIALGSFALLMIGFLYSSFRSDHEMINENYYEAELEFQQQIDRKQNAIKDGKTISFLAVEGGYVLQMEPEDTALTSGEAEFLRLSSQDLDFTVPIQLNEKGIQFFPTALFERGSYTLKVNWQIANRDYYIEKKVFIQ